MKQLLFTLVTICSLQFAQAQSEQYVRKMKETMVLMDSARSVQDMQEVAAQFERIGDAEKTQWHPYYYAALTYVNIGWRDQKLDKDRNAEKVKSLVAKAEAIEKNADLLLLLHMVATQQMMVDPQSRWMTYGPMKAELAARAKALDPNNPRIYYLEGQDIFNTPASFGGGKDKAKPLFEKSVQLFRTQQQATPFQPTRGQRWAEEMLAKCSS